LIDYLYNLKVMTTNNEKLQKLFHAALLDTSEKNASLTRAFPAVSVTQPQAVEPASVQAASPPVKEPAPEAAPSVSSDLVQPLAQAGLCDTVSSELGMLLDEQHRRKVSRRRREVLMTFVILFGLTGGSFAWFVHSPQRVLAARQTLEEIRSAGDVMGIVAAYKKSLAKIATRASDINVATESMGVSSDQTGMKDVDMDAEMKEMMGSEGKTVGERNRMIKEKFGYLEKTGGKLTPPPVDPKAVKPGSTPVKSVKPTTPVAARQPQA
jgi:hypothetical protein